MADSSDIDQAVIVTLASDPELLGYMPNGVYWAMAPPGSTRFVTVDLVDGADVPMFQQRSHEDKVYRILARGLTKANPAMKVAAARIDALLEGAVLTVPGYTTMVVARDGYLRFDDVDDVDPTLRWLQRGGLYRVVMSL